MSAWGFLFFLWATHSLVEVNEPDCKFLWSSLVPMDGVPFLKGDHRLILLVMGAFAQSPLQIQGMCVIVIFYDFHFQVG